MSIPPIVQSDVIEIIGDSISSGFGVSFGWSWNFMRAVKAKYSVPAAPTRITGIVANRGRPSGISPIPARPPTGYAGQWFPSFGIDASPGAKVGDYAAIIATTLAPCIARRTTVYIVELGINDATAAVPAATFAAQVATVRDAIVAAPFFRMLIWVGPWSAGENWPDGANPWDTSLDGISDKDAQLSTLMAATPNCYFISWRQLRINTVNATTNPTHATTGIYTGDGTHPTNTPTATTTSSGGDLLAHYTVGLMSFA